jgi:hypothetical protein
MYDLAHPGTLIHEVIGPRKHNPLLGVGYSCAYWIDHICEAYKNDLQRTRRSQLVGALKQHFKPLKSTGIRELISTFFKHHFLHWLEALSLLGVVTNGVFSLTRLRSIVPVSVPDCEEHEIMQLITEIDREGQRIRQPD